jgi:serine/threonine-protein kinase
MGEIYEAEHVRLSGKRVALKVLHPLFMADQTTYVRFRMEAQIVSALGHAHIIEVSDFNELEGGQPYMVMEWLDGEDLGQRLERDGPPGPAGLARLVRQSASALQRVHEQKIVHRDLKPGNIFLLGDPAGEPLVKLLDFGISKIKSGQHRLAPEDQPALTRDKTILGTLHYMSPEQAAGAVRAIDHTTDIFSLGVIAYLCLSERLPFEARSLGAYILEVNKKTPTPVTDLAPDLHADVDRVLSRAMAKKPARRYQRAETFAADLSEALARRRVASPASPRVGAADDRPGRPGEQSALKNPAADMKLSSDCIWSPPAKEPDDE